MKYESKYWNIKKKLFQNDSHFLGLSVVTQSLSSMIIILCGEECNLMSIIDLIMTKAYNYGATFLTKINFYFTYYD